MVRTPKGDHNFENHPKVGTWMQDDSCWCSFVVFGLGLEDGHLPTVWAMLYMT